MNRCLSCLAGVLCALVLAGCGGGSSPPLGKTCLMNSECANPLSCTFGKCHAACVEARDCPNGQLCIKSPTGNVCQQAEESLCQYRSQCQAPLICAIDRKCRSQCLQDIDCPTKTQKCVQPDHVCAEPAELGADMKITAGNGMPPVPEIPDGGLPGATGGAGGAIGTGGAGGSTADGAAGAGGSTTDGAAGAGGSVDAAGPDVPSTPITVEVMADKASVRQGDLVTLTVTGPNVSMPGNFEAGGYAVALQPGGTMTMFKASVAIPHGATIGAKDFKFTTAAGVGEKKAAFTVTAITAGPMGDDANRGTTDNPFKTYTKALTVASANDTIALLDGKYGMGETWMKAIPDKVTILGTSTAGTILEGPGAMGGSVSVDGLTFAGDATVKNLTVGYFNYNVRVSKPGTIVLDNVKSVGGHADGLYVDYTAMGAKITISGAMSDFTGNTQSSIQLANVMMGASLTISGGVKLGSMTNYPIYANVSNLNLTMDDVSISSGSNYNSIYLSGNDNTVKLNKVTTDGTIQFSSQGPMYTGALEVNNSTMMLKMGNYGITFYGKTLGLSGTTINGGAQHVVQNSGSAKIRGSKFMNYTQYGVIVHTGTLDMGTAADPGTNEFAGPDTNYVYGLYDYRNLATDSLTSSFTTFNGLRPDAGKVTASAMTPVAVPGKYSIRTVGNSIEFF